MSRYKNFSKEILGEITTTNRVNILTNVIALFYDTMHTFVETKIELIIFSAFCG